MRIALAMAAALASACGAGQKDVVPHLPGDGDSNTARPRAGSEEGGADDWWSGRTLIAPPPPLAPAALPMPPVERFALKNGLTVIAVESVDAPTIQVQLAVKGGRKSEPREKVGLSSFVASMLTRGARGKNENQLTAVLEQAGAQLTSNASFETLIINCHAPAAGRSTCLDTVAAMAVAPSFPAGAISEVRTQLNNAARQARMDPVQLTNIQFQHALWGDENVRGWTMTEKSVAAIQRADLVAWHKAQFTPKNAVLLVVGPKPAQIRPAVERAFAAWQGGAPKASAAQPVPALKGMRIQLVDVPGLAQAHVRVGRTGVAHSDPDFAAASLVNHVLGGSESSSRITRAIRKSFGGRAGASSSFDRNVDVGAFVAAGVAPNPEAVALMRILIDQITSMAADGPSAGEVKAAITELAGGYQTRLESVQEIGSALLAAELHGFDQSYVRDFALALGKVSAAGARSSAARWLDGKNLVVVLTGSAAVIEPQLMEAGLRYERVTQDLPVAGSAGKPAEPSKPASPKAEAAARAVLEAALTAKGGAEKLAAVKSLSWKGKAVLNLPNGQVPAQVEKRFVTPDKLRLDMVIEMGGAKMSITTALAGDVGWAVEKRPDGSRVIDFPASEIEAGKAQIWRDQDFVLLRHREKGATVAPLDDVQLDGVAHHAIRVTAADGKRTVVLLVDKKSKKLAGMTYEEQGVSAEERFGNYKPVNGVQVAQQRSTKSAQVDLVTKVTDIVVNPSIDAGIFARPPEPKKPAGQKPGGQKPAGQKAPDAGQPEKKPPDKKPPVVKPAAPK